MVSSFLLILLFAGAAVCSLADPTDIEPLIVNGVDAQIAEFPFMVSLRVNGSHWCGGNILNQWWVLTMAHCLDEYPVSFYSIQYGNTVVSPGGTNVVQVAQLIGHANFQRNISNQNIYDIGLVRVAQPINNRLYDYRVRLPLPFSGVRNRAPATIPGWGYNATGGVYMTTLQKANIEVLTALECSRIQQNPIRYGNICAGVPGGGVGSCVGDSATPLLVDRVAVGLGSWTVKPCGQANWPGVYTQVSHYIYWIIWNTGIQFRTNESSLQA